MKVKINLRDYEKNIITKGEILEDLQGRIY